MGRVTDLAELAELAVALARSAADLLRNRPADLEATTKSSPTDAVTVMDRAAEALILDGLRRQRPRDRVISEESGGHDGDGAVTWVVDPLDGTVNYLYGLPHFAVSIAAEVDGRALAGVVLDVVRDELYVATRGGGATCNGRPLRCTAQGDLSQALLATGFAYSAKLRAAQADVLRHVLPRVRDLRRMGSAALDLCAVAAGRVDGYFESGMHHWDWAAAALIAREAGARVGGLNGREPSRALTLAANPALFRPLEDLLTVAGAGASVPAS
jgi:myo-inositol-1(or 4)-monophosphatase